MARQLRATMSLPEVLLCRLLRAGPDGVKFRRQHPLGDYVLDFYCAKARVCLEIDGIAHGMGDRPARDEKRDDWLRAQGVDVLRIPASDVLKSPEDVAGAIVLYCQR
jgi:very-short-patch-repair endonuclease